MAPVYEVIAPDFDEVADPAAAEETLDAPEATTAFADPVEAEAEPELDPDIEPDMEVDMEPDMEVEEAVALAEPDAPVMALTEPLRPRLERGIPFPTEV